MNKKLGYIILLLGLSLAMYALFMDTTMPFLFGRINNLGLLNDQQNYLIFSLILVVTSIFIIFNSSKKDRNKSNLSESPINRTSKYENIEKISSLLEKGILTKEEFEEEKKKILSNSTENEDIISDLKFDNKEVINNENKTEANQFMTTSYKLGKLFGKLFK
jgi:uncharacterized membrane protein